MESVRVDLCYRPMKLAWAIRSGDIEAFRRAVKLSYAFWGGRFNPIIFVDREKEARRIVSLFRADVVWPLCDEQGGKQLQAWFPHLKRPFFGDSLFVGGDNEPRRSQVLDVLNAFVFLRDKPEWRAIKAQGVRLYSWQLQDPLADVLLMQFGAYPPAEETGRDLRKNLQEAADATEHKLAPNAPIPGDSQEHASIAYFSRHGLEPHYSLTPSFGWSSPGFFVGDASSLDDLVCHWNLRAANIPLWFIDPLHLERYGEIVPQWEKTSRQRSSRQLHPEGEVGLWSKRPIEEIRTHFPGIQTVGQPITEHLWNGLNLRVPMMSFPPVSTLGMMERRQELPRISFALSDKPFSDDTWFHFQHLVASVRFFSALYGDEQHTLELPFVPDLNEYYAREMCNEYNKLRVEPERIGLVIDACDPDAWVNALPVDALIDRILQLGGCRSSPSPAGLIVRQLIKRLEGLQGARAFKLPGVRRLLRTYGPTDTFTQASAMQIIGSADPERCSPPFKDTGFLLIEGKQVGKELTPADVFGHLVAQGLFRIGVELVCAACRLKNWIAIDSLRQKLVCELCGESYDATRQLVGTKWHYRRSGLLGLERNAQGAVPVVLTLQQLQTSLRSGRTSGFYSSSVDVEFEDKEGKCKCELDFLWIIPGRYPQRAAVILAECKDKGPVDARDMGHLRRVADALPASHFETYILLTKLVPFTAEEIEQARQLNSEFQQRVILLTDRELDPYQIYERIKKEFDLQGYGNSPEDLARTTYRIYFRTAPKVPPPSP
jgi:hypothetical protein